MGKASKKKSFLVKGSLVIGGLGIAAGIWNQAIDGSAFLANVLCVTSKNTNCSYIVDQTSYMTPIGTDDDQVNTATGGLATDKVAFLGSPFGTGAELSHGLRFGTGAIQWITAEVVTNPWGHGFDVVRGTEESSSGTYVYFDNLSATGTFLYLPAGSGTFVNDNILLGPDEGVKLVTVGGVASGVNIRVKGAMFDTETY